MEVPISRTMDKIIHLTSKDAKLTPQFQKNMELMQSFYPDWEIRFHSDAAIESFVKEYFPAYYQKTFSKMPRQIMKIDTVRYMWMYVYGGMYCDFDIRFFRKIEFNEGATFISRPWTHPDATDIPTSIHNCIFASTKGHPIWMAILNGIEENVSRLSSYKIIRKVLKQPKVFDVTGPNAISRIVGKHIGDTSIGEISILPGEYLFQSNKSLTTKDDAFVEHEMSKTWIK